MPKRGTATPLLNLSEQIRKCNGCKLRRKCKGPVPGVGLATADILAVGLAPGWQEDREGLPWISQSGQFLSEILESLGHDSKSIYFTYLTKCFPGRTRKGMLKPPPYAIEACAVWLEKEIKLVQPRVILAVGAEAMKFFDIKGGIRQNGGKVFETKYGPVIPVLHPDGLVRNRSDTPIFVTQLRVIATFLRGFQEPPPFEVL